MHKKISVITVCLNSERTIETTIKSVLEQEYDNFEYIIIDGGSTDRTLEIVRRYIQQISCLISEPDYGVYDAMNKGIENASGDIIGILNSDDWYERDVLRDVSYIFEEMKEVGVLFGDIKIIEELGNAYVMQIPSFKSWWRISSGTHPSTFIRKDVYNTYGKYDSNFRIAADFDFLNRVWKNRVKFGYIRKVFTNFRLGGLSTNQKEIGETEVGIIRQRHFNTQLFIRSNFQDLIQELPLYIYGIGWWGLFMLEVFLDCGIPVAGLFDDKKSEWGRVYHGITVQELLPPDKGRILVTAINDADKEIDSLCRYYGIPATRIIPIRTYFENYERILTLIYGACLEID